MKSRRKFIKLTALSSVGLYSLDPKKNFDNDLTKGTANRPIVIATWNHGMKANAAAWQVLSRQGNALDAVELGVKVPEADPEVHSVGYGGFPDREGHVTLDACIMDHHGNCGGVAFLQHIKHPISVARKVMEETPHVLLAGEGALSFALEQGFRKTNLLTPYAEKAWKEWLKQSAFKPPINTENHDTIGMLALDENGNLAGACTTSGAAFKMHGRIGDSPIIGAGLFVDNEIGAATATGVGEAVIKIAGSHLVVELMRQGYSPEDACKVAVERIISKTKNVKDLQVGFLALNKDGEYGGYSIHKGFNFAVRDRSINKMIDAKNKF